MDGLSYWIFLAVFYLLSAFMKKRREQVSDNSTDNKPNIFQNQFFQDLFQDMKEVDVESEDSSLEEFENSDEKEISEKEYDISLEDEHIVDKDLSKFPNAENSKKIKSLNKQKTTSKIRISFFNNSDELKRGIIIKEILDKPRALRKNIF